GEGRQKTVNILSEARRIHFIGVGGSGIIAPDAQQKFLRIDKLSCACSDMRTAATLVASANADKGDVVIGFAFAGGARKGAEILQLANENNINTIRLTKYGHSIVAEQADINLYTSATQEPTFRSGATSSRMAQLQVIDILFMSVASLQYDKSVKHLDATRDALNFLTNDRKKYSRKKNRTPPF